MLVVDIAGGGITHTVDSLYLVIWGFALLSTLYRSYHNGWFCRQRKPVYTVGQDSVL